MNCNSLFNMKIDDEEFPPIEAGINSYYKTTLTKENNSEAESRILFGMETHSSINSSPVADLNSSLSPIETNSKANQEPINVLLTPRKRAVSAYQARFLNLSRMVSAPPINNNSNASLIYENESDASIIARREKQIEYGKSTPAYERYCAQVPREKRTLIMPRTPEKLKKYSRRQFDGLVKAWKIRIHEWDLVTNGKDMQYEQELSPKQNSPVDKPSYSGVAVGKRNDRNSFEEINIKKTPTEKAIEKAIMDWRDEYKVQDESDEIEQLNLVKKIRIASSDGSFVNTNVMFSSPE